MSVKSGVQIEPEQQTSLLNACMGIDGVVMAGVPGAGGFDAIFCVYIGGEETRSKIEKLWLEWKEMSVCPLLASQSSQGIRIENRKESK